MESFDDNDPEPFEIIDLSTIDYMEAFSLQMERVENMIHGKTDRDTIFMLEHFPVFTLGKRGGRENLVVTRSFLDNRNIPVIETARGGNITYHGPGQLVVYPIVNIERHRMGIADFVNLLEEAMIRTARDFGVETSRNPLNHGIWAGSAKIGSIGLSVKRGICCHGLALNVDMDLTPFTWINPCGLSGVEMTSLRRELSPGKESSNPFRPADDESDNKSDNKPDNESDNKPDNESDNESDNKSDNESDNKSDNKSGNESDNKSGKEPNITNTKPMILHHMKSLWKVR
ncbi:MAG: lipoyl(octanoyl) transferase LipB [Desulfamplus sp.]|nr:lipoyl(octanoyl) transferase LipB [Desulfamplus sp.]